MSTRCLIEVFHKHPMYRWVIKDSNLSLFIQLSEETHPSYTGSDTHSGYFRSFYSHSSLYYLSAPCGSTHMYWRASPPELPIALDGSFSCKKLFCIGRWRWDRTSRAEAPDLQSGPLPSTEYPPICTRLQYMFFNKGKEIITVCCWSLCMAKG